MSVSVKSGIAYNAFPVYAHHFVTSREAEPLAPVVCMLCSHDEGGDSMCDGDPIVHVQERHGGPVRSQAAGMIGQAVSCSSWRVVW